MQDYNKDNDASSLQLMLDNILEVCKLVKTPFASDSAKALYLLSASFEMEYVACTLEKIATRWKELYPIDLEYNEIDFQLYYDKIGSITDSPFLDVKPFDEIFDLDFHDHSSILRESNEVVKDYIHGYEDKEIEIAPHISIIEEQIVPLEGTFSMSKISLENALFDIINILTQSDDTLLMYSAQNLINRYKSSYPRELGTLEDIWPELGTIIPFSEYSDISDFKQSIREIPDTQKERVISRKITAFDRLFSLKTRKENLYILFDIDGHINNIDFAKYVVKNRANLTIEQIALFFKYVSIRKYCLNKYLHMEKSNHVRTYLRIMHLDLMVIDELLPAFKNNYKEAKGFYEYCVDNISKPQKIHQRVKKYVSDLIINEEYKNKKLRDVLVKYYLYDKSAQYWNNGVK